MKRTEILEISIDCGEEVKGRGDILKHKIYVSMEMSNIEEPFLRTVLEAAGKFEETLKDIFSGYPASENAPCRFTKSVWDAGAGRPKRIPIGGT